MQLRELVEESLTQIQLSESQYVVSVQVGESKIRQKINVFLDDDYGIDIDELSRVSRSLSKLLDEKIENAYTLEVSSPGADAPISLVRQYKKHIGRSLKISLLDGQELEGKLIEFQNNQIKIEIIKNKITEPIDLEIEKIKTAKVIISFK